MFRKIAILIPMLFLCLGLGNCKRPIALEEPEPIYEYRYNVEVVFTRTALKYPECTDWVRLHYNLFDPVLYPWKYDIGNLEMDKIEENKFRCYLPKVCINTPAYSKRVHRHSVSVEDDKSDEFAVLAEHIDVQGAYDLEIKSRNFGTFVDSTLWFKMSKN
ncbi:MAG: hypothetical protein JSV96_08755 [Candidatus Aminicenantes bacterium]|nr:MAG: hypothetical protein JSV96_08755 [Candidatus Aminicenantes bacterium]